MFKILLPLAAAAAAIIFGVGADEAPTSSAHPAFAQHGVTSNR